MFDMVWLCANKFAGSDITGDYYIFKLHYRSKLREQLPTFDKIWFSYKIIIQVVFAMNSSTDFVI